MGSPAGAGDSEQAATVRAMAAARARAKARIRTPIAQARRQRRGAPARVMNRGGAPPPDEAPRRRGDGNAAEDVPGLDGPRARGGGVGGPSLNPDSVMAGLVPAIHDNRRMAVFMGHRDKPGGDTTFRGKSC